MKKLLLVLFSAVLLISCSADEVSRDTHDFTIPRKFRGQWEIYDPQEREGEIVIIQEHSIQIVDIITTEGVPGATDEVDENLDEETFYNLFGNNCEYGLYFYMTNHLDIGYRPIEGQGIAIRTRRIE